MHFIVHCIDREDALPLRQALYDDHKRYLASARVHTVISGPLLDDDGQTMKGSCFLLEADSKEDVVAFNRNDPFCTAGVWKQVSIHPFTKRVDNRDIGTKP
ncbi:YciI family protein [Bradyrhizobium erythrophlei]|uniref:YciI family protein n=1 Tax=Bradyrhizobium erythrophlei TaxID=1437360 RepID=UPI0035E95F54